MGMLEDLTELLIDRGHDMTDVVRGPFNDTPASQTALIPTPSTTPPLVYCGAAYEVHRVAIQVKRLDPVEARARAQSLYADLFGVIDQPAGDSTFKAVIPQSAPFWIDEDANRASIYGFTAEVRRRDGGS